MFDRFYRAEDARSRPGSGLGLSIVRDVVERAGGTVEAANRPGGGAVVGFRLPLAEVAAPGDGVSRDEPGGIRRRAARGGAAAQATDAGVTSAAAAPRSRGSRPVTSSSAVVPAARAQASSSVMVVAVSASSRPTGRMRIAGPSIVTVINTPSFRFARPGALVATVAPAVT